MELDHYELKSESNFLVFEFISEGPKGSITKLVKYNKTNLKDLYNLAFGDKNETGKIDDRVISNNGDSEKILATVVSTVYTFTEKFPEALIYATGSTKSRTRLYRIGITRYLPEILSDFELYGQIGNEWHEFTAGIAYEAFLVKRKKRKNGKEKIK